MFSIFVPTWVFKKYFSLKKRKSFKMPPGQVNHDKLASLWSFGRVVFAKKKRTLRWASVIGRKKTF